jgi:histidinol-phosphate aminotransferase
MSSPYIRQNVEQMKGYVPGEQPRDKGLIKLNTNENPYPPSPRIGEYLKTMDPAKLRLYPDPLSIALREKIAEVHGCDVSNVFAGNGSDEVLALCTRAYVEDDGTIGFFNPSYSLYPVLAEIRGVETRVVELGDGFSWRMPAGYSSSLFFLTNPNAPTSLQYDREAVRAFCAAFKGVVLIDEAYVDFASYDCIDLALSLPNVLVARSFSKSYSLAGLRVGYCVGPAVLIEALYMIKDSYNIDRMSQEIARIALEDISYMRANAARIKATRGRLRTGLESMGFRVYDSNTNFLWIECGARAEEFYSRLRKNRILVRYFPGERTGGFVRVTVGTEEEADEFLKIAGGQQV